MTNDMIALVSTWKNRLNPSHPRINKKLWCLAKIISKSASSFREGKSLENEAMITYTKELTQMQSVIIEHWRTTKLRVSGGGYSMPCGHCACCGNFAKRNKNLVSKRLPCSQKASCFLHGKY